MLVAKIHGKRIPETEGHQEDWLTSAVFGNLRLIPPVPFWLALLECALTVETPAVSLASELRRIPDPPRPTSPRPALLPPTSQRI
jgi:hypothetical protein